MDNETNKIVDNLKEKSIQSFLLGIEIYNKPTITYRLESFAIFICNAWELMLKAYLVKTKGLNSIYFKDKKDRTISLENCIKLIFTNDKDPVRKNLEIIIGLRNSSTHFFVNELERIYYPFLQSCVLNYSQKIYDLFEFDITDRISSSFMTLVTNMDCIEDCEILSKYGENIYKSYKAVYDDLSNTLKSNVNDKLAINIDLDLKIVKSQEDSKIKFRIAKDGDVPIETIKEVANPNLIYPLTQTKVINQVVSNFKKKGKNVKLTINTLGLIIKEFDLKNNLDYFFHFEISDRWGCSQKLVMFLNELLVNNPDIIDTLKEKYKKNK